jgi:hypothetical protein
MHGLRIINALEGQDFVHILHPDPKVLKEFSRAYSSLITCVSVTAGALV